MGEGEVVNSVHHDKMTPRHMEHTSTQTHRESYKVPKKTEKVGFIGVWLAETWVKMATDLHVRPRQEDSEESKILMQGDCT